MRCGAPRRFSGKIEAGKSGGGNAYGYRATRGFVADGSVIAGNREFHHNEATIVRIFQEFAQTPAPDRHRPQP